ncbi:MAG: cytochrome c biogenesis protein CcdA [Myxococcota bacterium]|nr:cytochrome c biogenesis protein CcdA [Myxococcota bacterium]MDW8362198.1 cytochrome c biogenesis protein CcdA [Myxococcales bacterium]
MNELSASLANALSGGGLAALPLALVGGLVTGLNPCCIALYPAATATCCATRGARMRASFGASLACVAGIALATTLLGVMAAVAGRTMTGVGGPWRYLIALVPIAMGMHLLGWARVPFVARARPRARPGARGALLAGLALGSVTVPCGSPVLAAVLTCAAYEGSAAYGALLLFAFGLGTGLPLLLMGTAAGALASRLDASRLRPWVDRVTGAVLLGVGFLLLWTA